MLSHGPVLPQQAHRGTLYMVALFTYPSDARSIQMFIQFLLDIIQSPTTTSPLRATAWKGFQNVLEAKPKLFVSKKLVLPTLTMMYEVISRPTTDAAGTLFKFADADAADDVGKRDIL